MNSKLLFASQAAAAVALIVTIIGLGAIMEQSRFDQEKAIALKTRSDQSRKDFEASRREQIPPLVALAPKAVEDTVFLEAPAASGSGALFLRTDNGKTTEFVWTCAHVVTLESMVVQAGMLEAEQFGEKIPARVVASGNFNNVDVALLVLDHPFKSGGSVKFTFLEPRVGEYVCSAGNALAVHDPPSFFAGIVSAVGRIEEGEYVDQVEMPGYPGCSGAPAFNLKGDCTGLVEARKADGLGFVIPSRSVIRWAREQGYEWALDPTIPLPATIPTYRIAPPISVPNSTQPLPHDYGK